jgi:hypothetical protein
MFPAVHVPRSAKVRIPVEVKLKPRYRYNPSERVFESSSGARFDPFGYLPKKTRIVYKTPALAEKDASKLSRWERELRRHLQVILPHGASPRDYVDIIRKWPSVEGAEVGPEVSLPHAD